MLQYKTMEFMLRLIHFDSCNIPGLITQDEAAEMQAEVREEVQVMSQHPRHHLVCLSSVFVWKFLATTLHRTPQWRD